MKSIYEVATLHEIIERINLLKPDAQGQWGKMNVSQMLAHCCAPLAIATGEKTLHPPFIMKLFAPFMKDMIVNDKPFKQGLPTAKEFIVVDARDFNTERAKLISLVTRLSKTAPGDMDNRRHPFFGKFTAAQWSNANVKHLDHHLKQFGV